MDEVGDSERPERAWEGALFAAGCCESAGDGNSGILTMGGIFGPPELVELAELSEIFDDTKSSETFSASVGGNGTSISSSCLADFNSLVSKR